MGHCFGCLFTGYLPDMTNHLAKISNNAALRNTLILCLSNIWWLVQLTKLAQSIRSYGLGSRQPPGSHISQRKHPAEWLLNPAGCFWLLECACS